MSITLSEIRNVVRQVLRDEFTESANYDFEDDELNEIIKLCNLEVSNVSPCRAVEPVLTTAYSKKLDISSLEDVTGIRFVEYAVGGNPVNKRNFEYLDNETIEVNVSSAPSTTGESGTLTGTVTFTSGSATVTGSGTDFDGELAQNYFIKPSGGSRWYRVYSVESATSLTLDEPVKTADNGADTVSLTQYRYGVALIHYDKVHTLTEETSTLPSNLKGVLIDGAVANASLNWIGNLRKQVSEAIALISDINSSISKISPMLDIAVSDLAKGRALVGTHRDTALSIIDDANKYIDKAMLDINNMRPLINKVNTGSPENDWGNLTSHELSGATARLNTARSYLIADDVSQEHANMAARELSVANTHLNQGGGYVRELNSRLSIAGTINSYRAWANERLALYKDELRKLKPLQIISEYSTG